MGIAVEASALLPALLDSRVPGGDVLVLLQSPARLHQGEHFFLDTHSQHLRVPSGTLVATRVAAVVVVRRDVVVVVGQLKDALDLEV